MALKITCDHCEKELALGFRPELVAKHPKSGLRVTVTVPMGHHICGECFTLTLNSK